MKCKVEFLPGFWADYEAAIRYISFELNNPSAARSLDAEFDRIIETVREFPHLSAPYPAKDETGEEYRCFSVKNYLAFYVIRSTGNALQHGDRDEPDVIEFRRFLYAGSDIPSRL